MTTFKQRWSSTERTFETSDAPRFTPDHAEFHIDPCQITVEFRGTTWIGMKIQGYRVWPGGDDAGTGAIETIYHREDVPDWALPLADFNFEG